MKKLLSLLVVLGFLVSSAAIMGCGDDTKKDKDKAKDKGATPAAAKDKDKT